MHELVFPWWRLLCLHIASPIDLAHRTRQKVEWKWKYLPFYCAQSSPVSTGVTDGILVRIQLTRNITLFFISRQTKPSSTCWRGWRSAEFVCTPPVADCTVDFRKFYFYRQTRFSSFVFPQVQLVKLHRSKFSIIECIFSLPASNFPFSFEDNFPN